MVTRDFQMFQQNRWNAAILYNPIWWKEFVFNWKILFWEKIDPQYDFALGHTEYIIIWVLFFCIRNVLILMKSNNGFFERLRGRKRRRNFDHILCIIIWQCSNNANMIFELSKYAKNYIKECKQIATKISIHTFLKILYGC